MDRAAKLAAEAEGHLLAEEVEDQRDSRFVTRRMLAEAALRLGFSSLEISAAVDQALIDAGTTP